MKNIVLLLVITFSLINCNRDPDKDVNPGILPEATNEGKNTGGCLINNVIWVASTNREMNWLNPGYTEFETLTNQGGGFSLKLGFKNIKNDEFINISIRSSKTLELNRTYQIIPSDSTFAVYSKKSLLNTHPKEIFHTSNNGIGEIVFTKFSNYRPFISGKFNFIAKDSLGNTVNVTEGRFDRLFIGG